MNSLIRTAQSTADQMLSSLVDSGAQARRLITSLRAVEARGVDSLLDHVGLRRRGNALGPVVWFVAGAITAGAIVFLLAPESGKRLRGRIVQLWESRGEKKAEPPAGVAAAVPTANGAHEELAHHRV